MYKMSGRGVPRFENQVTKVGRKTAGTKQWKQGNTRGQAGGKESTKIKFIIHGGKIMKKSLVMAMAMAMGVTASAYAANPFSDVPAGHWAYDAVAQLAASGVVEGYGATFGGDKLMTRYEMAQIVAKAMAKGANTDKLAAEFADELDALGVRVAKLEKKVDNVKITGNIRYSYRGHGGDYTGSGIGAGYNRFRSRLFVNGQINDGWKYTGMLENDRYFAVKDAKGAAIDNDKVTLKRAWLDGRLGGIKFSGGRKYFVQNDMLDAEADGFELKYSFGKVNLTGWMMRNVVKPYVSGSDNMTDRDRVYMAKVDSKFGKLGAMVEYWAVDAEKFAHGNIWEVGLSYPVAKGLTLAAQYYRGSLKDVDDYAKNGWEAGLKYMGAKAAKPGTWGAWFTYMDRPYSTIVKPTALGTYAYNGYAKDTGAWWDEDGYKGFEIGANYAFAKNIVGTVRYYDLKGRDGDSTKIKTYWGDVTFTF